MSRPVPGASIASEPIEVVGLRKSYAGREVLEGLTFEVRQAEVFALLGPNGAGKTTTVEILEGFRRRDGGQVSVCGHDPRRRTRAFRRRIGVVLQSVGVDGDLTVREAVKLFAGYYPDPLPVAEVIERVQLGDCAPRRITRLSGGQRRRLDLALGIVGRPDVLFLDEPTTGFDPEARRAAWEMVRDLQATGTSILLTTHYMEEAEAVADRVAMLVDGRIRAMGTPQQLGGGETEISFRLPEDRPLDSFPAGLRLLMRQQAGRVVLRVAAPEQALAALLAATGGSLPDLVVRPPSLEDIYLEVAGHSRA